MIPKFSPALVSILDNAADEFGIDRLLFACLVQKESSGNTWAWNPEPRYRYLWDVRKNAAFRRLTAEEAISPTPPADFPTLAGDRDQEWWGQRASWGVAQVMGAVARERGFKGAFLTELCDVHTGAFLGAMHLGKLLARHKNEADALASYNAGTPDSDVGKAYAKSILLAREELARELKA